MKKTKQHISFQFFYGIPLLLAGLVPYLMILIFWFYQYDAHRKFEETLSHTELTKIEVNKGEFYWVEKGKEIMLNNRMFDVKKTSTKNGKFVFWGLYDDEETSLINNWMQMQGKETGDKLLLRSAFMLHLMGQSLQTEVKAPEILFTDLQIKWSVALIPFLQSGHLKSLIKPPNILS